MARYYSHSKALQCLTATSMIIASHIDDPKDLLSLSRACKGLLLCFPSWSYVWKQVLERCGDRIPPCPVGRQPRTWIILQFTCECMTCGDDTANALFGSPASRFCDHCEALQLVESPVQPAVYLNNTYLVDGVPHQRREMIFWRDIPRVTTARASFGHPNSTMNQRVYWSPATYHPEQFHNQDKINAYWGMTHPASVVDENPDALFVTAVESSRRFLDQSAESTTSLNSLLPSASGNVVLTVALVDRSHGLPTDLDRRVQFSHFRINDTNDSKQ
ncbi:hypothetical protein FRC12_004210 [Ceratobasidium sp. 428]|nr:hypothetical protein FRC12_004210 [Ceratobasidium sp. 428]